MHLEGPWAKPTIEGDRVQLRPIVAADAEAMWEMVNDPESNDLTQTPPGSFTLERIAEWCTGRADADERLDLAIIERATGQWAGEVVLNEFSAGDLTANFRIALRGPAWFGRGLGGEATRLIVAHGLGPVGLRRITLTVLARNQRAIRAYERAGFHRHADYSEDGEQWVAMEITRPAEGSSAATAHSL